MSDDQRGKQIKIPGFGDVAPRSPEALRLGPLLGMAVGDALGTTYEFKHIEQPPYPTLATSPATDVVGGGPFGLVAGQITDDTQMAICLARSVVEREPTRDPFDRIDRADIARRYVDWYQHAFDVGNQTASALRIIEDGGDVSSAGRKVWHSSGRRAAGNGSLMRAAPLAVLLADSPLEQLVEGALTDSLITHADPRCAIACAAFDAAIAAGIGRARGLEASATSANNSRASEAMVVAARATSANNSRASEAMVVAARAAIPIASARLRELWSDDPDDLAAIDSAEADLTRDLDAAVLADPKVYGLELDVLRTAGFVRVAFRLAFWHLMHTEWQAAVVDVASRGGDADTNAAIVGALLGARDGVTAIPAAWQERVLAVTQPGPADWAEAHHPRHLLALAQLAPGK